MTETAVPFEPRFGAFVLESLTLGMYGESRNAIREYVQNGFDSLRQAIADGLVTAADARIDVEIDADCLTIRDNGGGLRTENAARVLAAVGASNKNYRNNAGFRGIGRLAGIVFCNKLIFTTKAKGEKQYTKIIFDAALLRTKLSPNDDYAKDAAETLAECVTATRNDAEDAEEHYFEVKLEGLHNPPDECRDANAMRTYLSQVAPLPYDPSFAFADEIKLEAEKAGFAIESVRIFLKDGIAKPVELFKPYVNTLAVKRTRAPITGIDYPVSPTRRWWGWVSRKRVSGAVQDPWKGIRVRLRNLQIDDTRVMREIFADSHLIETPRSSYSRFADWYVGEILIDPNAAIPNARRDGFEENQAWEDIRNELDAKIATPLGKQAYKTSKADKLSLENLNKAMVGLTDAVALIEIEARPTAATVEPLMEDAASLRANMAAAIRIAEGDEIEALQALAVRRTEVQRRLEVLYAKVPAHSCEEEIGEEIDRMVNLLFKELKARLGPQEWLRARTIVTDVTGIRHE